MPTFQPPTHDINPPVLPRGSPEQTNNQYWARRRYSPNPVGINVYLLTDGTITTKQPWDQSTIAKTWFGGHIEPVTAAEAAALTAAGYGAYIT